MSTSKEYIDYVLDRLEGIPDVFCRKMFGEYMVYVQEKPVLLVCDNCVMVKKLPELAGPMKDASEAVPYEGARAHYVLDIDDRELTSEVIEILVRVTPLPKKKKRT